VRVRGTGYDVSEALIVRVRVRGTGYDVAAKHEKQMQEVAPEVVALSKKLERMQRDNEEELRLMAAENEREIAKLVESKEAELATHRRGSSSWRRSWLAAILCG
jgi:hypothetical protein